MEAKLEESQGIAKNYNIELDNCTTFLTTFSYSISTTEQEQIQSAGVALQTNCIWEWPGIRFP